MATANATLRLESIGQLAVEFQVSPLQIWQAMAAMDMQPILEMSNLFYCDGPQIDKLAEYFTLHPTEE